MTRVLLLHGKPIPHYRVPIYGYLGKYLKQYDFDLLVTSKGIQADNPHEVTFNYEEMPISACSIARLVIRRQIDVVILFVDMGHAYLFPTYLITKGLLRRKIVYWGQGLDLAKPRALKNLAYVLEHILCDSLILYAEHLKKYISPRFHKKTFVANNTLCISYPGLSPEGRERVLAEYGIRTRKNIICIGRLQKRKRLDHLIAAHAQMNRSDVGLILAGPDTDDVLRKVDGPTIYKVGPVYDPKKFDLLSAADVFCLPGAVGLSIVDAFLCGLPIVTEEGDESAEMMYLKDGKNGYVVPRGDIVEMANKLLLLLDDSSLRQRFAEEAKKEIAENGHIDKLCAGFRDALFYATGQHANSVKLAPTHV
jgi:glycosyltransferase involved in cell wall biosynthesis